MPFGGLWNLSQRLWLKEWFPRPTLVWRRGLQHGAWTNTFWSYSWFFKNVWVWDIFKGWVKLEVILVWTPRRFFLNYRRRSKTKRTCKWFAQTWGRILSNILYRTFWWRFSASHCTSENIYFSLLELVRSLSHLKKCQAIIYLHLFLTERKCPGNCQNWRRLWCKLVGLKFATRDASRIVFLTTDMPIMSDLRLDLNGWELNNGLSGVPASLPLAVNQSVVYTVHKIS